MKILEIILLALAIAAVTAQDKNTSAGKPVSGSYTYSVQYSDNTNNNNNNYGHKIQVKNANPKINIDFLKIKNSLTPTEKHQRSNAASTSVVPNQTPVETPLMHYQKYISAPITTPSFAPPQPAHAVHSQPASAPVANTKFTSKQLALLLSQNKNPYLPLDKETEKQLSYAPSPAWANLLATVPQQQNPPQYASPVHSDGGYSHQAPASNYGQSPLPAHLASFSDQVIQQLKAYQQPMQPSVAPGAATQSGGYQPHYNQPQNSLPQYFPDSRSPAVPQTASVPASFPVSNNHFAAAQPATSTPSIQHSFPGSYGSPAPQISYQPQNVASLPSPLQHSGFPSSPVQYNPSHYQTAGQQSASLQFPSQPSQASSTVKYEPANLPQGLAHAQNQGVPNLPKDFSFLSSQSRPQILNNHYEYQRSTTPQYSPQLSNTISAYGQSGAASGLPSTSPYSSAQALAYQKPEIPATPVTQFSGQSNTYGASLGSYTSRAPAGFASSSSQGSIYGSNTVQGYTAGASSNQVLQTAAPTPYNDVSKSFVNGVVPASAQYTVKNTGAPSGYSPVLADNTVQKSYRTVEYSPAPVTENANVRYVYVMSHGPATVAPSNIK